MVPHQQTKTGEGKNDHFRTSRHEPEIAQHQQRLLWRRLERGFLRIIPRYRYLYS
jgi:hypothetical protein